MALHCTPPHLNGRGSNLRSEVREFQILFKIVERAGSMATIAAGYEDQQDFELIEPSKIENWKKGKPFSYA